MRTLMTVVYTTYHGGNTSLPPIGTAIIVE